MGCCSSILISGIFLNDLRGRTGSLSTLNTQDPFVENNRRFVTFLRRWLSRLLLLILSTVVIHVKLGFVCNKLWVSANLILSWLGWNNFLAGELVWNLKVSARNCKQRKGIFRLSNFRDVFSACLANGINSRFNWWLVSVARVSYVNVLV